MYFYEGRTGIWRTVMVYGLTAARYLPAGTCTMNVSQIFPYVALSISEYECSTGELNPGGNLVSSRGSRNTLSRFVSGDERLLCYNCVINGTYTIVSQ